MQYSIFSSRQSPVGLGGELLRTNLDVNPVMDPSGTLTALQRWGYTDTRISGATDGPLPGITSYVRATAPASAGTHNWIGFDFYLNADGATPTTTGTAILLPVTANLPYTISAYIRASMGLITPGITARFHDGAGNWSGPNSAKMSSTAVAANAWTRVSYTLTAPAGAKYLIFRVGEGTSITPTSGSTIDVTGILIEQSATVGDFFCGITSIPGYAYSWASAPYASASYMNNLTIITMPWQEAIASTENNTSWSVTEDATPLLPNNTSAGATAVSLGVAEFDGSERIGGAYGILHNNNTIVASGQISNPSGSAGVVSISALSELANLNVIRLIAPYQGTVAGYCTQLLQQFGIAKQIVVDPTIGAQNVALPGFDDNVQTKFNEFCAVWGLEVADKNDTIYIRPIRQGALDTSLDTQPAWSSDDSQLAPSVSVVCHNSAWFNNALIYPPASFDSSTGTTTPAGWNSSSTVLTVDAGSTAVYTVPILGTLTAVEQPTCVASVGPNDGANGSVYTVIGQGGEINGPDGNPTPASVQTLTPSVWTAKGGSVSVAVGPDGASIVITITSGSNDASLAPFAIAMNSGSGTTYSSLRIRGTGVLETPATYTYPTGLTADQAPTNSSVSIDSPFITNKAIADRIGAAAVAASCSPQISVTGSLGKANLGIGDVAGSRFQFRDQMVRVSTVTTSDGGVTFTALQDTLISDLDAVWSNMTFDEFDAVWSDQTFWEFAAAPLSTQ